MPLNRYVVRVDPQGQTVVVDVLDTSGASVIAYESSQFGAATLTLPLTITAQTDFWLHDPGAYDISCKVGGAEVADAGAPKRVQLSDVPVLVVPDWERERTASPGGSSLVVKDEGTTVVATASALDFVGAGVTATDGGSGKATVTIPGAPVSSFNTRTGAVVLSKADVTGTGLAAADVNADAAGAAAAAQAASAPKLVRTVVKTANYTAAPGDLIPCDTTSAAFSVTLPSAPAVGSRVAVKIVTLGAGNFVTIACGGTDVFNKTAGATTATLQLLGHAMNLQYDTGGIWTVVADDVPKTQLDATFLSKASNLSDLADAGTSRSNLQVPTLLAALVVATGNITLSGTQTIDGVAVAAGDHVLAAGQTTQSQNGPWIVAAGAWTRPTDYAAGAVVKGRVIQVMAGTANAGTMWVLLTSASVTVDTTSTLWQTVNKVSGAVLATVVSNAAQATTTSLSVVDLNPAIASTTFVADGTQVVIEWGVPGLSNNTVGDGCWLQLTRNDGTGIDHVECVSASVGQTLPVGGVVSLDTPAAGVTTSYKLQLAAITGGTAQIRNLSATGQNKIIVRHA